MIIFQKYLKKFIFEILFDRVVKNDYPFNDKIIIIQKFKNIIFFSES